MASSVIRAYSTNDLNACRRLWLELTEWHRGIYNDPSIGGDHADLLFDLHLTKVGASRLWVLEVASQVVGLVGLESVGEELYIEPLIVDSQYRGKGYGSALLNKAILEAQKLGEPSISVKPVARNQQVIRFFYNRGFTNLGHIQLFRDFTKSRWKKGPKLFGCNFKF